MTQPTEENVEGLQRPAFTAGVRPGGLTDETQIQVLLCYIVKNFEPVPVTELQEVLWDGQLINYFELFGAVEQLCKLGNLTEREDGLYITRTGAMAAETLVSVVPRSVRDRAMDAMLKLRARRRKETNINTSITTADNGESLLYCQIDDLGHPLLECTLSFPDEELAAHARRRFLENSDAVYQLLIAGLVGDRTLAAPFFEENPDTKKSGT